MAFRLTNDGHLLVCLIKNNTNSVLKHLVCPVCCVQVMVHSAETT